MRFTLRPGADPIAEADSVLLRALGLPSGGIVKIGETHTQIRPASLPGADLLLGGTTLANSGREYGASVDVTRAFAPSATLVRVVTLPLPGSDLAVALHGRVLTTGDNVTFHHGTAADGAAPLTIRVLEVAPNGVGVVGAGSRFSDNAGTAVTTGGAKPPSGTDESAVSKALLAGLDTQLDVLTGWFSLLANADDLEAAWGLPAVAGVVIEGPVGCGKAQLVAAAASRARAPVHTVDTSVVFTADSLLDRLADSVNSATGPRVIFVDRLEAVIGGSSPTTFRTQALAIVRWFLDAVAEKSQVVCVIGAEKRSALDPTIGSSELLARTLAIPPPDLQRRELLFAAAVDAIPHGEIDHARLAALSSGFSGADIQAAVLHASAEVARTSSELNTDLLAAAIKDTPPSLGSVPIGEVTGFGFDTVANLTEVKERLTEAVIWPMQDPERFARLGIDPPKGILLHGPPGTGKTFVIKALAHEAGAAFFSVKGAELLDKFVGESERGVRDIFSRARAASPSIIFFDEFDALAPVRGKSTNSVTDSVVAALLTEIDGISDGGRVSVIAATNRKDLIDSALLRAGRFETHLLLDLPKTESRRALLDITDVPLADDVDLDLLAEHTDGLSFADLTAVLREAALVALRSDNQARTVTDSHVTTALTRFRADRSE